VPLNQQSKVMLHVSKRLTTQFSPFPSGTDAEPNADPGGVPAEEEADEQELATLHMEKNQEPQASYGIADTAEWLAAECYELDQLARLNTYQLTRLPHNRSCTGCAGLQDQT